MARMVIADVTDPTSIPHELATTVIACIEDPAIIKKILMHLDRNAPSAEATPLPHSRAPPRAGLFD